MSVRGQSRKPLQAAVLGAVAALAFTGDMIVHRAREESTAASRTVVQQHRIDSERASTTATATQPLTLYLVGSDEDAGRVRSALAAITDTDGQPIGTSVQVLPVGTAGSTTLTVAPPGGGPPDSQR